MTMSFFPKNFGGNTPEPPTQGEGAASNAAGKERREGAGREGIGKGREKGDGREEREGGTTGVGPPPNNLP
jgi:hypothetical protein